ncbi:phosphoribosyltransferase-like protein [Corallococcus silvisoli]|uniref:phosphoribosyltransferase-like protein n=1 Tax=Corallococcus silvisoli TaxID=2697031 RepID=UPI0013771BDD|nr:hypothetical protein [Corallococcus silvisoli]NBD08023.1 hypothetical protein [Corallococcus silvisoli]
MRPDTFVESVIARCEALKAARLWHGEPAIRPRAWLENFSPADRLIGAAILSQFIFIADAHANKMITAAFGRLVEQVAVGATSDAERRRVLDSFLANAVFTRTEGEDPNPTDSGNMYCRKVRQVLQIPESRILEPHDALQAACSGAPVVFVDDFIGSGNQMIETWKRPYRAGSLGSFEDAFSANPFDVHYLCIVASSYGMSSLRDEAEMISVHCAHELDEGYSVRRIDESLSLAGVSPVSGSVEEFLERASQGLILPAYMRTGTQYKYGYHDLALTLAFEHSVPDATIPIIWAPSNSSSWVPLCPRR